MTDKDIEAVVSYALKTVKSAKADFGKEFDFKAVTVLVDRELERMDWESPQDRAFISVSVAVRVEMLLAMESFFDPKKALDAWRELLVHEPKEKENDD